MENLPEETPEKYEEFLERAFQTAKMNISEEDYQEFRKRMFWEGFNHHTMARLRPTFFLATHRAYLGQWLAGVGELAILGTVFFAPVIGFMATKNVRIKMVEWANRRLAKLVARIVLQKAKKRAEVQQRKADIGAPA